jgi:hypothetical protein
MVRGWNHGQHNLSFTIDAFAAASAQHNPFVVIQDPRTMNPACAHKR